MNKTQILMEKIRTESISWGDFSTLFELESNNLIELFNLTQEITRRNFNNVLKMVTFFSS